MNLDLSAAKRLKLNGQLSHYLFVTKRFTLLCIYHIFKWFLFFIDILRYEIKIPHTGDTSSLDWPLYSPAGKCYLVLGCLRASSTRLSVSSPLVFADRQMARRPQDGSRDGGAQPYTGISTRGIFTAGTRFPRHRHVSLQVRDICSIAKNWVFSSGRSMRVPPGDRPYRPKKVDTPHGNFEIRVPLNELDLCGLFLNEWHPDLNHYSVKTFRIPETLNLLTNADSSTKKIYFYFWRSNF